MAACGVVVCRSSEGEGASQAGRAGPTQLGLRSTQAAPKERGLFDALKEDNPDISVEDVMNANYREHQQQFFADRDDHALMERMERRLAGGFIQRAIPSSISYCHYLITLATLLAQGSAEERTQPRGRTHIVPWRCICNPQQESIFSFVINA